MQNWKKILYALLAVAALVLGGWRVWLWAAQPDMCAGGVERIGRECVGVNGEGYDFGTPTIGDVSRAIADENKKVADDPHVTVAMMLPLQSKKPSLRRQMRSDLQGAYLGQLQANSGEGEPPKIRLVLANPGRDYAHQNRVVDSLVRMADSRKDRLRAVTGFNLSLGHTEDAVRELTRHQIPVLASRISGDRIANSDRTSGKARFPGLARIIPTNHDAAQALASFNRGKDRQDAKTVLVYDKRSDVYNQTLADAFRGIKETGRPGPAPMSFESSGIDETGSTGNQFTQIANNICDSEADHVYFAGRTLHLRIFALKLAAESCKNRHYTIISGSDAASLRQSMDRRDWRKLRGKDGEPKVTVQYAAPAHPDSWSRELSRWKANHDGTPPQYLTEPKAALKALRSRIESTRRQGVRLGSTPNLEDSRTMLVYDGLVTIGTALHQAQGGAAQVPGRAEVRAQWPQLHLRHRVRGTSGLICLTNEGNPYDKPVSVVQLDPGREGSGTLKFIGLAWPTGKGQPKDCNFHDPTS